jgi:hypothetical protein
MKRALLTILMASIAIMSFGSIAFAGQNEQAAIAVHIAPWAKSDDPCIEPYGPTSNHNIQEELCSAPDYWAYVLVCNGSDINPNNPGWPGSGVGGAEFGLQHAGLTITSTAFCSDQQFTEPGYPNSGTGILSAFDVINNCQSDQADIGVPNSVIAILEVHEVVASGPAQLVITPRPGSGFAKVADCGAAEDDITASVPSHLGIGGFCDTGYDPCFAPTPTEETTWGGVKSLFQ